jgi:hypothetical protein
MILLNSWNHVEKGSYRKIFKHCIFGVDFISRHEIYICKIFNFIDECDNTTSRNKEAINHSLFHPIFVKI